MKEIKLQDSRGAQEALHNHDGWAAHTFGGIWKGLVYGCITAGAIGTYLYLPIAALLPWVLLGVLFHIITMYDSTLVQLWNEREMQRVLTKYTLDNLDELIGDEQVPDSEGNLDGTNGDE